MNTNGNDPNGWKKQLGGAGLKIFLVLLAVFWLMVVAASWAESSEISSPTGNKAQAVQAQDVQRAPATEAMQDSDDEYNFSWLDPEKKIYVLQNRRYLKGDHAVISLLGGPGLSNSYRTVWNFDPRLTYYFSESFGIEAFYTLTFNGQNTTYKALTQQTGGTTVPVVREYKNELGLMGQWVPWYAKINVFNKIIYFDWYFQAGLGQLDTNLVTQARSDQPPNYADQKFFALYAGTGQLFHLSQDWLFRIDFTGSYYQAPLQGNAGDRTWFSNYNFEVGFGYRL